MNIFHKHSRKHHGIFYTTLYVVLVFILLIAIQYAVTLSIKAQSCFTLQQIQTDSRCLYIYQSSVYQKGSRTSPHHGHPCGSDVTSVIPNSHLIDKIGHLDPNYQGEICPAATATPTPSPTITPTLTSPIGASATPVPGCPRKSAGDANCDGTVDLIDFEQWRREFALFFATRLADFNGDTKSDLIDFELWRRTFIIF
jgi:hypothetical protein